MKNINEIAKEMTRSEFMNWYTDCNNCEGCPNSGFGINIDDDEMCKKHEGNCIDCIREATRDIKFKGDIEETFEAICINKGDAKYLTNDKPYLVSQSKEYENYYDLINDIGNKESYKKERFEVMEVILIQCLNKNCEFNKNENCTGAKTNLYKLNCVGRIKPQHTPNYAEEQLEYAKEKEIGKTTIMECINNESQEKFLTLNKKYEILEENDCGYLIIDDTGHKYLAHESRFKVAEKPINYEEEYKKLKEENEKYREAINDFNKCLGKSEDNNKRLKKEVEELKNNFNKKQDQWENEQVKQVEVLIKESDMLRCQYEEAKQHIEALEKEKESHVKQIKDLVRQHNEEQREKLIRQKQNIDLKNTVKTLASML